MTVEQEPLFPADSVNASGVTGACADTVEVSAGPSTDLFVDPGTGHVEASASVRARVVEDRAFQFEAYVQPALRSSFDAGALLVRCDENEWAKLCLEQATSGAPTAVSVVTRGLSDDANGWVLPGPRAWLRISRDGETFAFHISTDGSTWDLLRIFSLPAPGPVEIGLVAQSPTGDGCTVSFSALAYVPEALKDPRGGD